MSLSLSQLYVDHNQAYGVALVAGEEGLKQDVSWVQVTEDISYSAFLKPHVLVFTTGIGNDGQAGWLEQFIAALIRIGAAGLIINTGAYIQKEDISRHIKDVCNNAAFPLFTMPWKIRLADITQEWLYTLFLSTQEEYETMEAWKKLLFTEQTVTAQRQLQLTGWEETALYAIVAIDTKGSNNDTFVGQCKSVLNDIMPAYFFFTNSHVAILIAKGLDPLQLSEAIQKFLNCMAQRGTRCIAGSGLLTHHLQGLKKSYSQAEQALRWATAHEEMYCYFGDLGIDALLYSQEETEIMRHIHDYALGPVLQYDQVHNGSLYVTLQAYLACEGSLQAVAHRLYTHRNTIAYRMHKIENLLPYDLTDGEGRFRTMLACHIHEFLSLK
jgi:hypothetical protein